MDDIEVGIGLNETSWGSADSRAHIGDEETTTITVSDPRSCYSRMTYPSGFAMISSVMEARIPRSLFLKVGRYGLVVSK